MTMTPTDLAAALLRDVKRHGGWHALDPVPVMYEADVLSALSRALDPALTERAGEVLEGVTPGPWTLCRLADQTPHSIQASYGCVNGLSAMFTLAHINVPDEAEVGMTDGAFDRETADANARFIVWCSEDVPALLAQNAALRAEQAETLKAYKIRLFSAEAERDALRAERDAAEQRGYANAMEAERKLHEDRIEALEAKLAKAGGLLEAWVELSEHCSIEEGVCCCGESMNGHSNPMDCGHTPLDHGAYIAVQLGEKTRAALTTEKHHEE